MLYSKQHIQECVNNGRDIIVDMCHLDSITMEDICMLIEIISVEKLRVILSDEVRLYLSCELRDGNHIVPILDIHNKEELAILPYLDRNSYHYVRSYDLYTNLTSVMPVVGDVYTMSDKFLICSKKCDVDTYLITNHIVSAYGIKYKTTPRNQYFAEYMSTNTKSAKST